MPGRHLSGEQLNDALSLLSAQCFVVDGEGRFRVDPRTTPDPAIGETPGAETLFELYGTNPDAETAIQRLLAGEAVTFSIERERRRYEVRAKPLRTEGKLDGALGVVTDVTERAQLAEQLRESEARLGQLRDSKAEAQLRHAVDHAPFILWSVNAEGVFTLAEGQGLVALGREPGQAVGHSAFELYQDLPEVLAALRRGLAGEEFSYVADVRGRIFETRTFPIRDAAGGFAGFSAVSLDVTERQRLEADRARLQAQMLQGQKLESLGLLAGGIAHDFNNILTVILGSAFSASLGIPENSAVQVDLDHVVKAAQRAADLARQMLAYSGRGQFEIRPIDLSNHVREIATLLKSTISKKVQLQLELGADLPAVLADTSQIQQVLMNLVLNGAEAIGDRTGTVLVKTGARQVDASAAAALFSQAAARAGDYVFVEVEDTGAGMDAATQARIFDPFFSTKFAGRGLGLSAVLGIVRTHEGAIQVSSTPGLGSTFTVFLPSSAEPALCRGPAYPTYQGHGLALVVDDDAGVRRTTRDMLALFGFSVIEAADGAQGIALFEARSRDVAVVLLDLTMPEMNGEEALREIRRRSRVPVIIMSGYSESGVEWRSGAEGFTGFLGKPFTPGELSQTLRLAFEGQARSVSPHADSPERVKRP